MTPLDYGLKDSKQGKECDTKTERLLGHHGDKQNNHSTFLQIGACPVSVDIKKKRKKDV